MPGVVVRDKQAGGAAGMAGRGAEPDDSGWVRQVARLYRYVWRTTRNSQLLLSLLAIFVFLLELVPLELQRRIVNIAVGAEGYSIIAWLCALYLLVVLTQGGLKLVLNVYRGSVIEAACKRFRLDPNLMRVARSPGSRQGAAEQGVAISVVASEVDAVGGFIGTAFSEPVLNGGILLSIFGYMLFMEPMMALIAVALFVPQVLFVPVLQEAINRRTAERIRTVRALAVDIVDAENGDAEARERTYRERVSDVYRLNMQIYRRKFAMTFLINLMHQFGVIGILAVGGWFLLRGETEIGTVVAFISGLARTNDPWNDLVDFFRNLANTAVKFELIRQVLERGRAA